jgi:hypothetical protein
MKKPVYNATEKTVLAPCPTCEGVTSFDTKGHGNTSLGINIVDKYHLFNNTRFSRIVWSYFRCNNCGQGGVAKLHDNGKVNTDVLESFYPTAVENAKLPAKVPDDLQAEFREAELVASHGAYRAASALLRSVLEKALIKNGYIEMEVPENGKQSKSKSLKHRIDAAASDGVITEARKRRAHENIRVLGNDILHDEWRKVEADEYGDAHLYSQRVLEDLYDDRDTVEKILKAKKRISDPPPTPAPTPSQSS